MELGKFDHDLTVPSSLGIRVLIGKSSPFMALLQVRMDFSPGFLSIASF